MTKLRAEQLKAKLKDATPHALEKALIEAVVRGEKWRLDATFDAIERNASDARNILGSVELFANLGRFGRFDAMKRIEKSCPYLFEKIISTAPPQMVAAFEQAVMHGNFDIADFCRTLGVSAEVDVRYSTIPRVVFVVARDPDVRKLECLLASGCQPEVLLYAAIGANDVASVRRLLERGFDVNSNKTIGGSALYQAISHSFKVGANPEDGIPLTKFLLSRGARLHNANELGHIIASLNSLECAKMAEVLTQAGIVMQRTQTPPTKFNP